MAQAVREALGLCEPLRVVLTVGEVEREGVREGDRVTLGEGVEEADSRTLPEARAERVACALGVGGMVRVREGLPLSEGEREALTLPLGELV